MFGNKKFQLLCLILFSLIAGWPVIASEEEVRQTFAKFEQPEVDKEYSIEESMKATITISDKESATSSISRKFKQTLTSFDLKGKKITTQRRYEKWILKNQGRENQLPDGVVFEIHREGKKSTIKLKKYSPTARIKAKNFKKYWGQMEKNDLDALDYVLLFSTVHKAKEKQWDVPKEIIAKIIHGNLYLSFAAFMPFVETPGEADYDFQLKFAVKTAKAKISSVKHGIATIIITFDAEQSPKREDYTITKLQGTLQYNADLKKGVIVESNAKVTYDLGLNGMTASVQILSSFKCQ